MLPKGLPDKHLVKFSIQKLSDSISAAGASFASFRLFRGGAHPWLWAPAAKLLRREGKGALLNVGASPAVSA